MRAVVQRVRGARATVDDRVVGEIGAGLVVLVGVGYGDSAVEARWLADKVAHVRVFSDEADKLNRTLLDVGGEALVVSQFTLYGDARKGRRPSFARAAQGREAESCYLQVVRELEARGVRCATGEFGAMMNIELTNSGPVTILLDSDKTF
jgi:D-tyrosyl-tRNA(Tyr) deacylase